MAAAACRSARCAASSAQSFCASLLASQSKKRICPLLQKAAFRTDSSAGGRGFRPARAVDVRPLYVGGICLSTPRLAVVTFKLADIGEGIGEVELTKWYKNVGDRVEEAARLSERAQMEEICEVLSDKAAVEITSRYTGKIVKAHAKVGETVKVGGALVDIDAEGADAEEAPSPSPAAAAPSPLAPPPSASKSVESRRVLPSSGGANNVLASPAVRRLAKEKGVQLELVRGSGKNGLITREDVLAALEGGAAELATSVAMNEALRVPHFNIGDEYDLTRLAAVRAALNKELAASAGVKLSLTSFLVKAVSVALSDFPTLNSKFDCLTQDAYTIFDSHNISLAIDTPHGLVVPNIKNVQSKSLIEIQKDILLLQEKALAGKLSTTDLTGGTIAISNVGVISGTYIKSLLFDGQSVILGVGKVQRLPRFREDGDELSLEAREIINCSFSADHRHCDGATVARFSKRIGSLLENPELMLAYLR